MALSGLQKDALKVILFGGKGGVGKTTCAMSTGFYLSGQGLKTLVISTDPAHSLADSLGEKVRSQITPLADSQDLSFLQIDAQQALSEFKKEHQAEIKKILDTATYLDNEDVDAVFNLPIPGIDEVMGFKKIADLVAEGRFDKYIVDTAPTGHALRLITLPQLLDEWIKVLAKMRWKYRYMVERFGGAYNPDSGDDFLLEMKKTVKKIENLLRDVQRCEFIAVTIPEEMAILETQRLVATLAGYGMKVGQLVVNNVLQSDGCAFCRARRKEQGKYLEQIKERFPKMHITKTPLRPGEVKGKEALRAFQEGLLR